ncbi:unnamed protein product [Pylaiella littoralis]
MNDVGELAASPPAAATEIASEGVPPDEQPPAQQTTVPESVGEEVHAALTPEYPMELAGSLEEDVDSEHSLVGGAPSAPTPTPNLSPERGISADDDGTAAAAAAAAAAVSSAAVAPSGPASATASRTICLRTLRRTKPSVSSSLAGWGGTVGAAAAARVVEQGSSGRSSQPLPPGAAAPDLTGMAVVGVAGVGLGVLPTVSKVVDLREVKKVKPGPLAASAAVAPVPADDSDGFEEEAGGGGSVKIDISVGKRMIEFQLNQNAAEEKREAARIKSERDRADATIAEESQRMLDQVNARMEAQRRERGGVLGSWRNSGISPADQDGGNAGAACAIDQSEMKKLAEKHGIVVRFVDDDAASGVAQVRALARAHGIRIQILGQENGEEKEEMPFVVDEAGGGDTATPPPVLSSLRTSATPASRSLSPAPQTSMKAPPRKTTVTPSGGMFSGPARMMRRALEASKACVPPASDVSPAASSSVGIDDDRVTIPSGAAASGDFSSPAHAISSEGAKVRALQQSVCKRTSCVRSILTVLGESRSALALAASQLRAPCLGEKGGAVGGLRSGSTAITGSSVTRANGGAPALSSSRNSRSEGGKCSNEEKRSDAAAITVNISGRKRRESPHDSSREAGEEGRGGRAVGATFKRAAGGIDGRGANGSGSGGSGGGFAAGGRMEARLGSRNATSFSGRQAGGVPSARGLPESTSSVIPNSAPKRMRLVFPSGEVVSQAPAPSPTRNSVRRANAGAATWEQGNNNLFKGAMAGIMGRGKRPSP